MDGTYEITDLNVTGAGKILKMKVNGKGVDIVTDIAKNADDKVTAISINGVDQNIAENATAYAWTTDDGCTYTNFDTAPADDTGFATKKLINQSDGVLSVVAAPEGVTYTKVSDTSFTLESDGETTTFTRDDTKDLVLWS